MEKDVAFVKQVPLHPRERLTRAVRKQNEEVTFVEVPFVAENTTNLEFR